MAKEWTSMDERNKFVESTNMLSAKCDEMLSKISALTNFDIRAQNIVEVYRKKNFELADEFKKHGMDYFSSDYFWARMIVFDELFSSISKAISVLESKKEFLASFLKLNKISMFKAISLKAINYFLEDYETEIKKIESYKLEHDFSKSLLKELYISDYSVMTPNSYLKVWGVGVNVLYNMGLQSQIEAIKPEALKLIEKQELASLEYEQSWKIHK